MLRLSLLLVVLLTGCQLVPSSPVKTAGQDTPGTWKTSNAPLSNLVLPTGAKKGQPVTLKATLSLGSSSCNKDGKMTAKLDQAARTITLGGTKQQLTGENVRCTRDLASAEVETSITPESAGTYAVLLEGEGSAKPGVLEVGE